jgi:hypothetical protein
LIKTRRIEVIPAKKAMLVSSHLKKPEDFDLLFERIFYACQSCKV